MALSGNTVWEVRTAGNDTNGGGFVTGSGGTDYSQQDSKNTVGNNISTTDAVANGTTTLTSATASFTSAITGNVVYFQGGTGSLAATRRQLTFVNSTTVTMDASIASGTGITMNIGGACASLGELGATQYGTTGNIIHQKSGTYLITTASTNVSNGCFSRSTVDISIIGYGSTRGDWGTKPINRASGISTFTLITVGSANSIVANISLDGADLTSSRGLNISGGLAYKCYAEDFTNSAFLSSAFAECIQCEATSCSSAAVFSGVICIDCWSHDNTAQGFGGGSQRYVRCISSNNSGGSTDGFVGTTSDALLINCSAYGNGRDGFRFSAGGQVLLENCAAEGNAGVGHNLATARGCLLINCAGYNNTGGNVTATGNNTYNIGFITGSASFFTNPGSGDFSLNSTAGGGAALKAAGYPGAFPGGLTTGYISVGAAQNQTVSPGEMTIITG